MGSAAVPCVAFTAENLKHSRLAFVKEHSPDAILAKRPFYVYFS